MTKKKELKEITENSTAQDVIDNAISVNAEAVTEEIEVSPATDPDHVVLTLTTGVKAVMDFKRATGRVQAKARMATNGDFRTLAYQIAEITLFDGKKITGEDILDMDYVDNAILESAWMERHEKKYQSLLST